MDLLTTHETQRFDNTNKCTLKLCGLLSCLSAFVFEVTIANCQCWCLWQFNDKVVHFVSLGLWEARYAQAYNVSGTVMKMLVHTPINSSWTISPEFQYAENLIVWAILMKPVVIIFSVTAIKISFMKDPLMEMQIYCFKICALVLCVSSLFTFVSVSWNHFADHYDQTTLDFPPDFPVKKEALISKHYTAVFPLGVLTVTISLLGVILFISEIISLKVQSQVKVKCASIVTDQEA